jgi:type I restriction enzyme S subunit
VPDERVIDSEFALKLLQVLSDEMQRVARGSTFTEMATSDLASILAPIPPLEEQRQIAAYLTYMDRRIGRLIAAKRRLIALLEEQKQAVIQRAVRRGLDPNVRLKPSGVPWLGDVPAGWKVKKLKFLVRSTGGMTPSKADDAFWRGEIPWVSPKDMKRATIVDTIDHISEDAVVATGIRVVQPPSVLIVVRGMILARAFPVAISAAPLTMNQDMKALTADARKLDPWFLRYLLIGIEKHVLTSLVEEAGHGTRCLRTDEWENLRVPLPPFDEQQDIKRHLDLALADTDASIDAARRQIDLLREYRTRLIADVVTGKLDVRGVALPAADGDADDAAGFGNELAAAEDADEGEDVEAAEDEGA